MSARPTRVQAKVRPTKILRKMNMSNPTPSRLFPADLPHTVHEHDGRVVGPGVGDDSVALAALSAVGALLTGTTRRSVWLLATVGEEGLGNLRGIIAALDGFASPIEALMVLEGNYLGRVSAIGVGSSRWRVCVSAPVTVKRAIA